MDSLKIINGTIVQAGKMAPADLIIQEGTIVEILAPGGGASNGKVIDARGLLILPGAIDIHFHCRAPAYPERGDFSTETRGAAAGGVTTIFEMPISKPGTSTAEIFEARKAVGKRDSCVNFGLYAAPARLDPVEIEKMVQAGAIGFKTFMTAAPQGREDEFAGLCAVTDEAVFQVLELIKPYPHPAVFHPESNQLLEWFQSRMAGRAAVQPEEHALTRPPVVESTAIAKLIALVDGTGRGAHVAHLSTKSGLNLVRDAQQRGVPVTAETCPHYLLFSSAKLREVGPFGKVNPPLRGDEDRKSLWAGLKDGTISVITTDHAPFAAAEKEPGWEDIRLSPPGLPSIDILYPLVLNMALEGHFSLPKAVELVSTRPAEMYRLPRKGRIQVGADADLVLFDPEGTTRIDRKNWFSKAAPCDRVYTGMELRGQLKQTILAGETVFRNGEFIGRRGGGKFVRPAEDG